MLQNELCVFCALGGVMTISKSRFRSVWRYSTHTSHLWAPGNSEDHSYCSAKHFGKGAVCAVGLLCCEVNWSPAVRRTCSRRSRSHRIRTVWCGDLLSTHNWKFTFPNCASEWWRVVTVVLLTVGWESNLEETVQVSILSVPNSPLTCVPFTLKHLKTSAV